MNTNSFFAFGLTRMGIEPEFIVLVAEALTTRPLNDFIVLRNTFILSCCSLGDLNELKASKVDNKFFLTLGDINCNTSPRRNVKRFKLYMLMKYALSLAFAFLLITSCVNDGIFRVCTHPNLLLLMAVSMEDWESADAAGKPESYVVPQCFMFEHVTLGSLHSFLHVRKHRLPLPSSLAYLLQVCFTFFYLPCGL